MVQQVATCTFYQLSTQLLKEKIDNVFIGYNLNIDLKYPWIIRVAGLAITYPNNSFAGNQTLGVKLLQKLFMLDQL